MLTTKEVLLEAYRRGHAWNPDFPNLQNIDAGRLALMDGSEADAKSLVASRQSIDANFAVLVQAYHQRSPEYDGEIGPATQSLLALPRCPMPDFPPPANASFQYDDEGLQHAVESQQRAFAMGGGSWPDCDPTRKGVNSFRVRIDPARMPSTISAYIDKALQAVVAAYAEMGCAVRYILDASSDCEIAKRFESLAGSTIGWNEFPQPDTCNQTINGRLDTGYTPSEHSWFANLECHETGHGVGLQHTRGSIMNPSITLVWPLTWRGSPSESNLKRWFGGVPLEPPSDPTDPGTPTPTGKIAFRGSFDLLVDGKSVGKYQVTPVPQV